MSITRERTWNNCVPIVRRELRIGVERVAVVRLVATRDISPGEPSVLDFEKEKCNKGISFVCLTSAHSQ